jgi:hypothetical protein
VFQSVRDGLSSLWVLPCRVKGVLSLYVSAMVTHTTGHSGEVSPQGLAFQFPFLARKD